MRVLTIAAAAFLGATALAGAQTQSTEPSKTGCNAAPAANPTPTEQDSSGGTAPGNTGVTGFTGKGLGGAYTGTTQSGALPSSPSVQPATAHGLDPIAAPPQPSSTGKC